MNPELAAAMREALGVAAEATTEDDINPFDPVPDGYYNRRDVPATELDEALTKVGLYRNARAL